MLSSPTPHTKETSARWSKDNKDSLRSESRLGAHQQQQHHARGTEDNCFYYWIVLLIYYYYSLILCQAERSTRGGQLEDRGRIRDGIPDDELGGEVKVLLRGASRYLGALSHVLSLLQCISSIIYCFYLLPDSMKTYYLIPRTARNNSIFKFVSSIVYFFNLLSDNTKSYYLIPRTARN